MPTFEDTVAVFTERERQLARSNDLHLARILAVKRLSDDGWSLRRIGEALGLSHERVRQLLRCAVN